VLQAFVFVISPVYELLGDAGSVATVEAAWTPLAAGSLPPPQLRLHEVAQRDVYDGGSSTNITCTGPI
jgi:hypothetical protein